MRPCNSMKMIAAIVVTSLLLVATQAQAILAYDFPTGLVGNDHPDTAYVVGNIFMVNSDISVTAVGAFNSGGLGFSVPVPVAIYQLQTPGGGGTWSQVSGTSYTFSDNSYTTDGTAQIHDLTDAVTLHSGTYAIVAANYGITANPDWLVTTTHPATPVASYQNTSTAITDRFGFHSVFWAFGSGLPDPSDSLTGSGYEDLTAPVAGATFDFTPVPEVTAFGAAAVGLLGLVYIGRYAGLRRKMRLA